MRILCLHGGGTSGDVLEAQLAPLKRAIDGAHEWVFIDGLYEHVGNSAVRAFFPGPFFSFHEGIRPREMREAHDYIAEVIEEEGPFDGVLGFSREYEVALTYRTVATDQQRCTEGASLAMSFMLDQKLECPAKPTPFRFAILFNIGFIVSPNENLCDGQVVSVLEKAHRAGDLVNADAMNGKKFQLKGLSKHVGNSTDPGVADDLVNILNLSITSAALEDSVERITLVEGKTEDDAPRLMHPAMIEARADIPTAIIVGEKDPLYPCALLAEALCTQGLRVLTVHRGGHDIPRIGGDVDLAVNSCKWAIKKAEMSALGGILM